MMQRLAMKPILPMALVALLLGSSPAAAQEKAIAAIKEAGGQVDLHDDKPGKPARRTILSSSTLSSDADARTGRGRSHRRKAGDSRSVISSFTAAEVSR